MARSDSKGQRVKTFKAHVPQPDGTHSAEVIQVYLDADANFVIYMPAHIAGAVKDHKDGPDGWNWHHGKVQTKTFDQTKEITLQVFKLYDRILKETGKKKVIMVSFKANRLNEGDHYGANNRPARISFAGNQALHFDYEVLFQSGDQLYRQRGPDHPLTFVKNVDQCQPYSRSRHNEFYLVEWTAEREAFLASIKTGLAGLIEKLSLFFGHSDDPTLTLTHNLDTAVAIGGGLAALPAPAPAEGDA